MNEEACLSQYSPSVINHIYMILSLVYIRQISQQYYGKTQWDEAFSACLDDCVVGTWLRFSEGITYMHSNCQTDGHHWKSVNDNFQFLKRAPSFFSPCHIFLLIIRRSSCWGITVSVDDGWKQSETIDR